MTTSKTFLTLALSSLLIFSGCGSEVEKTLKSQKTSSYSAQEVSEKMKNIEEEVIKEEVIKKDDSNSDTEADPLTAFLGGVSDPVEKTYTLAEVAKHNTRSDCWTVVNGTVAKVTSFFGKHSGGDDKLAKACGKNATVMFESVKKHDPK